MLSAHSVVQQILPNLLYGRIKTITLEGVIVSIERDTHEQLPAGRECRQRAAFAVKVAGTGDRLQAWRAGLRGHATRSRPGRLPGIHWGGARSNVGVPSVGGSGQVC